MAALLLHLILSASLVLDAAAPPVTDDAAVLARDITRLQELYSDGFGRVDPTARHIVSGRLFDTGRQDAVVFFSSSEVDLTNVHYEFVAIFARGAGRDFTARGGPKERPYHLVTTMMVGSRGTRTLDWKTAHVSKGTIVVDGMRWAEQDAGCCPTKPIRVTFTIHPGVAEAEGPTEYPLARESEVARAGK